MSRPWTHPLVGFGIVAALAGCQAGGDRPGFIILPGMVEPQSYEAFDAHPILGQTLRSPPAGTVPHGATYVSFAATKEDAERAGRELTSPFAAQPTAELPRAKKVFDTTCAVCHGPAGGGDGPVVGPGRFPNPPSLLGARARALPDGHLFHIVSYGQGLMPPHRGQVMSADRWRGVLYVRWLQGQLTAATPEPSTPPAPIPATAPVPALGGQP